MRNHISADWDVNEELNSTEKWVYVEVSYFLCSKHREVCLFVFNFLKSQLYRSKQNGTHNSKWGWSAGLLGSEWKAGGIGWLSTPAVKY